GGVDGDVAQRLDVARLPVDLDARGVCAARPREVRRVVHVRRLEARLDTVRQIVRRPRGERNLLQRDRTVRPDEAAAVVLHFGLVDTELVRGDLLRLLDDPLRRVVQRDAADSQAAAAVGV